MSFLNPLFLFGLAAAAIPIIIHLFTRRRPHEVPFPSLEFLTEVNQSEIRRLKLKQWLLLLLRTLAVAALALAMSRPALKGHAGPRGDAATAVVVLVDQSGSMGASGASNGTLLNEARRAAEGLLATLGPQDELLLVPYDDTPHPISPRPISDLGRLRAAVQGLEATARTTDHHQALVLAGQALAESHALNRELFWISDFQAAGFARDASIAGPLDAGSATGGGSVADAATAANPGGGLSGPPSPLVTPTLPAGPWDQVRSYLVPIEAPRRANVALTDAALAPNEEGAAVSLSAYAFGATSGDLSVEVRGLPGDAELGRGYLSLPERGEATTFLPLARLPEQGGVAQIPDDALALDNRRVFPAGSSGALRVLLREEGGPSALRIALEAGSPASGIAVDAVDASGLLARLGEADVIVLNDLERLAPIEQQAILDYHRAGGALLVTFGRRADATFWNGVLGQLGIGQLGALEQAAPGASWRLRRAVAGHPVLAGFPARPGEPLSSAQFQQVRVFHAAAGARTLLEFDRGRPALVEAPRVLLLAASLDPEASDFPVSGAFLPLVHQAVKVLGRGTAAASLVPGERYSAPAATGEWRIEDEKGVAVPAEVGSAGGGTRLLSAPLERPGLYRVLQGGALRTTFAVNPDPRESDLAPVPDRTLLSAFPSGRAQIVQPGADLARRVREARYGRELWTTFLILALLLLVAETIVARWGMPGVPRPANAGA